jgi:hypothetical protein
MTFGLSTLAQGMFDKQAADPRPCDTALGKAPVKTATAKEAPAETKPKEPAANPIEGATEAVKGVFDKLFGK